MEDLAVPPGSPGPPVLLPSTRERPALREICVAAPHETTQPQEYRRLPLRRHNSGRWQYSALAARPTPAVPPPAASFRYPLPPTAARRVVSQQAHAARPPQAASTRALSPSAALSQAAVLECVSVEQTLRHVVPGAHRLPGWRNWALLPVRVPGWWHTCNRHATR